MKTKILQTKHPRTSKGNTNLFPKHTKQPHNTSGQHTESKDPDLVSTITPSMFLRPTFVSRLGPPVAPNRSDRISARCATDQRHYTQTNKHRPQQINAMESIDKIDTKLADSPTALLMHALHSAQLQSAALVCHQHEPTAGAYATFSST